MVVSTTSVVLLLAMICTTKGGEASYNSGCWLMAPTRGKAICNKAESKSGYQYDRTMPYFMGDILSHILEANDRFVQISEESLSSSYLSKCASQFSDNLSLKSSHLPSFNWPTNPTRRKSSTSNFLPNESKFFYAHPPKASFYYAHIWDAKLIPKRFKFLDTALKRVGHNATLLLDYNTTRQNHVNMAKLMSLKYGGELHSVCPPGPQDSGSAGLVLLGVYRVGVGSRIPETPANVSPKMINKGEFVPTSSSLYSTKAGKLASSASKSVHFRLGSEFPSQRFDYRKATPTDDDDNVVKDDDKPDHKKVHHKTIE